jgi:hypothetical protein
MDAVCPDFFLGRNARDSQLFAGIAAARLSGRCTEFLREELGKPRAPASKS